MTDHKSDCAVHNEPAMKAGPCDCGAGMTDRIDSVDGNLDDVAIEGVTMFRLEYMDSNSVWIRLYRNDRRDVVIKLGARGKITGIAEYD